MIQSEKYNIIIAYLKGIEIYSPQLWVASTVKLVIKQLKLAIYSLRIPDKKSKIRRFIA